MKKKRKQYTKRKKGNKMTVVLLVSSVILTGTVVWIAMNDWDLERSFVFGNNETAESPVELPELAPTGGELEQESPTEPTEETEPAEQPEKEQPTESKPEPAVNSSGYIEGQTLPAEPTYIDGVLLANKKYPMPKDFAPGESKEARAAFDKMAAAAKLDGLKLVAFSTYRSFEYQTNLYKRYVDRDGEKAADRYSARPGYSEHQTGLAFDIGEENFEQHFAASTFENTEAAKWLNNNAHHYGFIMRYPKGKEEITGYMYESWHYRYVGKEIAEAIKKADGTLEEYLNVK